MNHKRWIAWRLFAILFHLIMFIIYFYALIISEITYSDRIEGTSEDPLLGDWKFMTRWMLLTHIAIWLVSTLNNISIGKKLIKVINKKETKLVTEDGTLKKEDVDRKLETFINYSVMGLGFPLGMFVIITFWGLYWSGPKTVLEGENRNMMLTHLNHTLPLIAILIEVILIPHRSPSIMVGLKLIVTFTLIFLLWMVLFFVVRKWWLYPIMGKLDTFGKFWFPAALVIFLIGLYFVGLAINRFCWSEARISSFETIPKTLINSEKSTNPNEPSSNVTVPTPVTDQTSEN